jgi:hypothetical protein
MSNELSPYVNDVEMVNTYLEKNKCLLREDYKTDSIIVMQTRYLRTLKEDDLDIVINFDQYKEAEHAYMYWDMDCTKCAFLEYRLLEDGVYHWGFFNMGKDLGDKEKAIISELKWDELNTNWSYNLEEILTYSFRVPISVIMAAIEKHSYDYSESKGLTK